MGILDQLGGNANLSGTFSGIGNIILIILLIFLLVVVVGVFAFIYYRKKTLKEVFKYKIHIFKEIHGELVPVDDDLAREILVRDSNVALFYLKKRKMYIARPTIPMGKSSYWYKILENGEWVNFKIKSFGEGSLAEAEYDHRDNRYAYINMREIIKRNYRDKSTKWWKEYAPLISQIITSFIFILGCWLLLAKIGKLMPQIGNFLSELKVISENMVNGCQIAQNVNSGIVGA